MNGFIDRQADAEEWTFLHKIAGMLAAGGVLNTPKQEPIVRFEHPDQLKVGAYSYLRYQINKYQVKSIFYAFYVSRNHMCNLLSPNVVETKVKLQL